MLRPLFCTGALLALTIMHAAAAPPAATAPLPRLAVVCLDDNERTKTLADLVQLELGKSGKVDMVERAEFERIMAEQKLSAAGLTGGGAQIAVGKALRADALLLLERDRKLRVFRGRLTDTQYAAQLCRLTLTNQDAPTVEDASAAVSKAVLAALAKLAVPPAERLLVSVLEIRNATQSKDCAWVETEVPEALETALIREPRVFVLDRQRLGELLKEVQSTAGSDAAFSTGAILVDGDLMVKQGVALGTGAVPVVLAVRLRGGDLTEIGRAQAEGSLDKARDLLLPVQADLVKKVIALGPQKPVSVETEKRLLLEAASRTVRNLEERDPDKAIAYTEAAHGLDAKDPQAIGALLATLPAATAVNVFGARRSPAAIQKAVDTVLRIQELLPLAAPSDRDHACFRLTDQQFGVLLTENAKDLTAEQRVQLRPMRALLRAEAERQYQDNPWWLVRASRVFFEDPMACNDYTMKLMERVLDPARTPPAKRARTIAKIFDARPFMYFDQPAEVQSKVLTCLEQLTRHDDCVARFFAAKTLADLACTTRPDEPGPDKARQRKYAELALAALPDVLARDELFARAGDMNRLDLFPGHGLREWATARGADPGEALARIGRLYGDMLDKGDFARYARTSPELYLMGMPPQDAIRLLDQAAALVEKKDRDNPFVPTLEQLPHAVAPWRWEFGDYFAVSITLRIALTNRYFPELAMADSPGRKVLLCTQSPAWKALLAEACRKWDQDPAKVKTLTPRSLLVDGDTVWIVWNGPGILLAQVDLATRQFLHTWIGPNTVKERWEWLQPKALRRWDDTLCVGTLLHGVRLCPACKGANAQETQLDAQTGGLLDPQVTALAALGDDLYIGTKSGLWRHNRRTAVTELVASSKAQGAVRCLQPETQVDSLVTDTKASKLYILSRRSGWLVYVQRWVPATGEFTDLSPVVMPKRPPAAADAGLRGHSERLDPSVDPFKVYERLSIFDPDTEKIVPERGAIPVLPADCSYYEGYLALWRTDVLVIRGYRPGGALYFEELTWSIEQLSGLPMPVTARK